MPTTARRHSDFNHRQAQSMQSRQLHWSAAASASAGGGVAGPGGIGLDGFVSDGIIGVHESAEKMYSQYPAELELDSNSLMFPASAASVGGLSDNNGPEDSPTSSRSTSPTGTHVLLVSDFSAMSLGNETADLQQQLAINALHQQQIALQNQVTLLSAAMSGNIQYQNQILRQGNAASYIPQPASGVIAATQMHQGYSTVPRLGSVAPQSRTPRRRAMSTDANIGSNLIRPGLQSLQLQQLQQQQHLQQQQQQHLQHQLIYQQQLQLHHQLQQQSLRAASHGAPPLPIRISTNSGIHQHDHLPLLSASLPSASYSTPATSPIMPNGVLSDQKRGSVSSASAGTAVASQDKEQKYKTELCRSWEETGSCRYGTKCRFAHSIEELRIVDRHPKYKTQMCKTFWEKGACPYGKRCCFIHTSPDQAGNSSPPVSNGTPSGHHDEETIIFGDPEMNLAMSSFPSTPLTPTSAPSTPQMRRVSLESNLPQLQQQASIDGSGAFSLHSVPEEDVDHAANFSRLSTDLLSGSMSRLDLRRAQQHVQQLFSPGPFSAESMAAGPPLASTSMFFSLPRSFSELHQPQIPSSPSRSPPGAQISPQAQQRPQTLPRAQHQSQNQHSLFSSMSHKIEQSDRFIFPDEMPSHHSALSQQLGRLPGDGVGGLDDDLLVDPAGTLLRNGRGAGVNQHFRSQSFGGISDGAGSDLWSFSLPPPK